MKKLLILATMLSFGAFAQTVDQGDEKAATIEAFVNVDSALILDNETSMDFGTLVAGESKGQRMPDQYGFFTIEKDHDRTVQITAPHSVDLKEQEAGADKVDGESIRVLDLALMVYDQSFVEEGMSVGNSASSTNPAVTGAGNSRTNLNVYISGRIQMDDATVAGSYKGSFDALVQYE